ncbi:MAG: hypothetical protein KC442_03305, partial [Thermomicrobiales bacterium]|nr:hypothetical protein [Thermomicrobiales bacterium]
PARAGNTAAGSWARRGTAVHPRSRGEHAMSFGSLVEVAELEPHLHDPSWALVDCRFTLGDPERGERDYLSAHVPGAVYAHLDRDLSAAVEPGRTGRHPLPAIADLAERLGAAVWAVFCLVPTGRAVISDELSPEAYEETFAWLAERSETARWSLKLTEGYHYRRVLAQRGRNPLPPREGPAGRRAPAPVNAGNGFCFISHTGEVCPSGFLPVVTGNVRETSVVALYRDHPVFRELREPHRLTGKCGACAYRRLCGGSRSRAYVHAGDYLASDPACSYLPPGYAGSETERRSCA